MAQVVLVAKKKGEETSKLPLENDGSLLYSTLVKFFPDARGLLYYTEMDTICGVHFARGKFYPPPCPRWARLVFYCAFLEENVMCVAEKEGAPIMELPLESDRSLLYSTLVKFFPEARGLMHYTQMADTVQGVQFKGGKFYPNFESCGSAAVFYCTFLKESQDSVGDYQGKSNDGNNSNQDYHCVPYSRNLESADNEGEQAEKDGILHLDFQTIKNNETFHGEKLMVRGWVKEQDQYQMTPSRVMKPHQCDICRSGFTRRSHLVVHRRIHTGEKPYRCSDCTSKFARADGLKVHNFRHHTTAKPVEESANILHGERVKKAGI